MDRENNILTRSEAQEGLRHPDLRFSVSSRDIRPEIDILAYLKIVYIGLDMRQIKDVFGNCVFPSRLYGGRPYSLKYALTDAHVRTLERNGIGLSLTLTNHFFDEEAYRETRPILKEHHKPGNSIICTSDELAERIRNDFPDYTLKASIIKNLNTPEKIEEAMRLYDSVTLPMDLNDDDAFLAGLEKKDRIILFGNATCAYTCPQRTCYLGFSQRLMNRPVTSGCSKKHFPRLDAGLAWFDVAKLRRMGYASFKMIPPVSPQSREVARLYSATNPVADPIPQTKKPQAWLCSYPKCGRSWLRFILAHYLNLRYELGLDVDFHSLFRLLPNDGHDELKGLAGYRYGEDQRFPLISSSHACYREGRFDDAPVIFLQRSVPDVVVSDYFQTSRLLHAYPGPLKEFIRDPKGGLHRYLRYLDSWKDFVRSGRAHLVRYEALHARTDEVVAGVLGFLQIPIDGALLTEAVRRSSFEAMQVVEKEKGLAGHLGHYADPEARRVRKGEVNGSLAYLDTDDLAYIRETCANHPSVDDDLCP